MSFLKEGTPQWALFTCPTCDPLKSDPDRISDERQVAKYLFSDWKCKNCGTVLEYLGSEPREQPK